MKKLEIEVSDSIYEHILFFLNSLPKNLIHLTYKDEKTLPSKPITTKEQIKELFDKNSKITPFKAIQDPIEWQREMRNEWE
ncbi:MAG: hypothetical protein U9N49_11275 [Campylobacterota bacterium]|nr:hypothetical protein [Campylobacterota bacterium]